MRADLLAITAMEVRTAADAIRDDKDLGDVPPQVLATSARMLRVGSYSAIVAARRLEQLAESRFHEQKVRRAQLLAEEATR